MHRESRGERERVNEVWLEFSWDKAAFKGNRLNLFCPRLRENREMDRVNANCRMESRHTLRNVHFRENHSLVKKKYKRKILQGI